MEVEVAVGAPVAGGGSRAATGVAVEGGGALVGRQGRVEGQRVVGVGWVGDEGGHLGTVRVEGESTSAAEAADGAGPARVHVASIASEAAARADGDGQIRPRLNAGELEGVRVAEVVDARLMTQLSHLSLSLSVGGSSGYDDQWRRRGRRKRGKP